MAFKAVTVIVLAAASVLAMLFIIFIKAIKGRKNSQWKRHRR